MLEAGSDVVRFETTVDWHEKHRMLRAEFRPAHYGDTALCEIQFGHIERVDDRERDAVETAQFEVVRAQVDRDRRTTRGGFALLNDSKYGHRAKNGLLSLNLLRSPTFPDKTADRGIHAFTYAFTPVRDRRPGQGDRARATGSTTRCWSAAGVDLRQRVASTDDPPSSSRRSSPPRTATA